MHTDVKVVIVGASSGIGEALARLFINNGYRVGIAARRVQCLQQLQKLAPNQVEIQPLDVTHSHSVEQLQALIHRLGGMDVYIHVAGIGEINTILNESIELKTVNINVEGFTRFVDFAFHHFANNGAGHLVAISSIAGTRGLGAAAAYSASKAYQTTYLQCLQQLIAIRKLSGITITDIRPGFVATPLLQNVHFPLLMQPESVAKAIFNAIKKRKRLKIIDWRYRILVILWQLIPRCLWERLPVNR